MGLETTPVVFRISPITQHYLFVAKGTYGVPQPHAPSQQLRTSEDEFDQYVRERSCTCYVRCYRLEVVPILRGDEKRREIRFYCNSSCSCGWKNQRRNRGNKNVHTVLPNLVYRVALTCSCCSFGRDSE